MSQEKKNGSIIAIITMIFLFGMISFVTNLAAPIGVIWKQQPGIEGSSALGMMGNMMNFLAYLFMGIPAGKLLIKIGYKKTALLAIAVGFFGVLIQFLSGIVGVGAQLFSLPANFFVYLLGAFVAGFSVCMLNTVVNPMLTLLGGGGKRGNQFIQIGGTFNSLMATLTPMLVGAMIGSITKSTAITDVNTVLFMAMGVFLVAFIILIFIPITDPQEQSADMVFERSPWAFRHFVLGVIAIFVYVGVEVGIPGTLNFFLSDPVKGAGMDPTTAATIAGFVAGTYWFLMLIGRFVSSFISGVVSSKVQLEVVSTVAIILVLFAMFAPIATKVSMPVFTGSGFGMVQVPLTALLLVLCGLCTSVMWGGIFNLAVEGLGKYTAMASGIFMMMVVGGGVLPLVQNWIADKTTYMTSYWVIVAAVAYILYYAVIGCKNVNKDIKVD
jgi:FHS family L-fucose permease-like MFS transporter